MCVRGGVRKGFWWLCSCVNCSFIHNSNDSNFYFSIGNFESRELKKTYRTVVLTVAVKGNDTWWQRLQDVNM